MSCRVRARGGTTVVKIPVMGSSDFTYNESLQTLSFSDLESDYVTITGNTATNAGSYTATATLKESNYIWEDGTSAPKTYSWNIAKRKFSNPSLPDNAFYYDGESYGPSYKNYDSRYMTISGTTSAVDAGSYSVTFTLKDPNNNGFGSNYASSRSCSWWIFKQTLYAPSLWINSGSSVSYDSRVTRVTVSRKDYKKSDYHFTETVAVQPQSVYVRGTYPAWYYGGTSPSYSSGYYVLYFYGFPDSYSKYGTYKFYIPESTNNYQGEETEEIGIYTTNS